MTDLELIARCVETLGKINVPIEQFSQIGVPIANVRNDLILLHNAVVENSKKEKEAPNAPDEEVAEEPKEEA